MPIATTNGKLAVMEWDQDYEPGLPLSPGTFDQADQQQLLWGFPEILWSEATLPDPAVGRTVYLIGRRNTVELAGSRHDVALVGSRHTVELAGRGNE